MDYTEVIKAVGELRYNLTDGSDTELHKLCDEVLIWALNQIKNFQSPNPDQTPQG